MGGKPRIRRSAEESRERILDAAEARLGEVGPAGLRLQALAADVGVSHPAILHHFGNREGLVKAVLERVTTRLQAQIVDTLSGDVDPTIGAALLDRIARTLGDPGNARMLAWLALERGDQDGDASIGVGSHLAVFAELMHGRRRQREPGRVIDREDTTFTVLLSAMVMFGHALAGPALMASAGLADDPDADRRFMRWLAELIHEHLGADD